MDESTQETWKSIPSTDNRYSASSLGRIRRDAPGRRTQAGAIIRGSADSCGYLRVRPFPRPDRRVVAIHRLVAEAFLAPGPEGHEVNHIDGDRQNNAPSNLEYVPHGQNIRHSFAIGNRTNRGVSNPRARLTPDDVRGIRRLAGKVSNREIARRYGIASTTVGEIISRVRWSHVE